jgi:hypothetical protein
LGRIFGAKRDEVTGEWRKLLIQYFSGDKIKKNEMSRPYSTDEVWESCVQGFGGET